MKRIITYLVLAFVCTAAIAENSVIDSLRQLIKSETGNVKKCELLQDLGYQYEAIYTDSAIAIYKRAISLAKKIKNADEEGDAYINLSFAFHESGDMSKVIISIQKGIKAYKSVDSIVDLSYSYFNLGTFYQKYNAFDSAESAYLDAIPFAVQAKKYEREADIYNNLGLLYSSSGRINSAIKMQAHAITIRDSLGLPIISSYINMALLNSKQNRYEKALKYNRKAYKLLDANTIAYTYETVLQEFGKSLSLLQKTDSAKIIFQQLIDFTKDPIKKNYYKAKIYRINKQFDKALQYFKTAENLQDASQYAIDHILFYNEYAHFLYEGFQNNIFKLSLLDEAIQCSKTCVFLSEKLKVMDELENSFQLLYLLYKEKGDLKQALNYAQKYIEIKQSNEKERSLQSLADAETKFELGKKNLQIQLLKSESETAELKKLEAERESKFQRNMTLAIGLVLLISLIFIISIFRQSKEKSKANQKLQLQNNKINAQNEEKELLLKEIHHRVKNNLQVISSLLELQAKKVSDTESDVFKEGQSRVRAMALIHEELYQNHNLSKVDFISYTSRLTSQIRSLFPEKGAVEVIIEGSKIELDIDTAIPLGLILNELITNAFKYGVSNEGKLYIQFIQNAEGQYQVQVRDNGNGLPADIELKKAKTLGLRLVGRLSRQLYGTFEHSKDELSTFTVQFLDTDQRKKVA